MGACLASCIGSCVGSCMGKCLSAGEVRLSQYKTMFGLLQAWNVLLLFVWRHLAEKIFTWPVLKHALHFGIAECNSTSSATPTLLSACFEQQATERVFFAFVVLFAVLFLFAAAGGTKIALRKFWVAKFTAPVILPVLCFLLPNAMFSSPWLYCICIVVAALYSTLQMMLLFDVGYVRMSGGPDLRDAIVNPSVGHRAGNSSRRPYGASNNGEQRNNCFATCCGYLSDRIGGLVESISSQPGNVWFVGLLVSSGLFTILALVAAILLANVYYAAMVNKIIIWSSFGIGFVLLVVSVLDWCKHGAFLPSSIVLLYFGWLQWLMVLQRPGVTVGVRVVGDEKWGAMMLLRQQHIEQEKGGGAETNGNIGGAAAAAATMRNDGAVAGKAPPAKAAGGGAGGQTGGDNGAAGGGDMMDGLRAAGGFAESFLEAEVPGFAFFRKALQRQGNAAFGEDFWQKFYAANPNAKANAQAAARRAGDDPNAVDSLAPLNAVDYPYVLSTDVFFESDGEQQQEDSAGERSLLQQAQDGELVFVMPQLKYARFVAEKEKALGEGNGDQQVQAADGAGNRDRAGQEGQGGQRVDVDEHDYVVRKTFFDASSALPMTADRYASWVVGIVIMLLSLGIFIRNPNLIEIITEGVDTEQIGIAAARNSGDGAADEVVSDGDTSSDDDDSDEANNRVGDDDDLEVGQSVSESSRLRGRADGGGRGQGKNGRRNRNVKPLVEKPPRGEAVYFLTVHTASAFYFRTLLSQQQSLFGYVVMAVTLYANIGLYGFAILRAQFCGDP
eukprot:g15406.t1